MRGAESRIVRSPGSAARACRHDSCGSFGTAALSMNSSIRPGAPSVAHATWRITPESLVENAAGSFLAFAVPAPQTRTRTRPRTPHPFVPSQKADAPRVVP